MSKRRSPRPLGLCLSEKWTRVEIYFRGDQLTTNPWVYVSLKKPYFHESWLILRKARLQNTDNPVQAYAWPSDTILEVVVGKGVADANP
jgi:hypothetical protein